MSKNPGNILIVDDNEDLLLAARQVGPTGHVFGLDVSPAMRQRCAVAAHQALEGRVDAQDLAIHR